MAFIYEKIREEDKEWVDFGRFKGMNDEAYEFYPLGFWTVDKVQKVALIVVNSFGRPWEEGYEVNGCGFFYKGQYVNFTILKAEYKTNEHYVTKWYEPHFGFKNETEEQKLAVIKIIKEALTEYSKSSAYDEKNAVFEF